MVFSSKNIYFIEHVEVFKESSLEYKLGAQLDFLPLSMGNLLIRENLLKRHPPNHAN